MKRAKATSRPAVAPLRELTGIRLWLARLGLAVLVPAVLLLALEGALNLLGTGYPTDLALKVEGTGRYGINLRYGWRFFPNEIARWPLFFSFREQKPPETCRVVVLGASAAQGYPHAPLGFARILEVMLDEAYPETDFQVINTAIPAINSHIVRDIAREFSDHEPDLYLVYLGNNEVIGPYGLGASKTGIAPPLAVVRAGIALKTTRTGQLIHSVMERFAGRDEMLERWGGMEMFAKHQVTRDDPALDPVMENFAANLRDICQAGEKAGAEVVLSTVAVNVWNGAPFASLHRGDLAAADLETWERHWQEGVDAAAAGRTAAAEASFAAAAALDDTHAELAWLRGNALLALGDTAAAEIQYVVAKELDVLRFRADDRINAVIRDVALDPVRTATHLVDAAAAFAALGPEQTADRLQNRFYEHVHLTFTGGYVLARALFPTVAAALPPRVRGDGPSPEPADLATCAAGVLNSYWENHLAINSLMGLLDEAPFPARSDHAELVAGWQAVDDSLRTRLDRDQVLALVPAYKQAIDRDRYDFMTRTMYSRLLKSLGERAESRRQWQFIGRYMPPNDWLEAKQTRTD